MLITGRHARIHLEGAGIGSRQARQVLDSGLAGAPASTPWAHYHESDAVMGLVERPVLDRSDLQAAFPHGLLVTRRVVDLATTEKDRRRVLGPGWRLSPIYRGWIAARIDAHGPLPLLATLAGFVVLGADVTAVHGDGPTTTLRLGPPGSWHPPLSTSLVSLGRGREWVLLGFPWPEAASVRATSPSGVSSGAR